MITCFEWYQAPGDSTKCDLVCGDYSGNVYYVNIDLTKKDSYKVKKVIKQAHDQMVSDVK